MKREIKFEFVYQHPETQKVVISADYTLDKLMGMFPDDMSENTFTCNCQPVGEYSFTECNCSEEFDQFELIAQRQFTGLRDKNGKEIYEGDWLHVPGYACYIVFKDGGFMSIYNHPEDGEELPIMDLGADRFQIIGNIYENL